MEQNLDGAVLLLLEDLVAVRRLLQGQVVGGEVFGAERVVIDQERQDQVDPALLGAPSVQRITLEQRSLRYFLGMAQPIPAGTLLHSFRRRLEAENRSERTLASYLQSVRQAEAFLAGRGKRLEEASRADLEAFLGDLLRRRAPATAATRYKVLRILYRWLEEEEEIEANPMARMKPSIVPEQPVPVVPEDGLRRLLAVCAGKDFEARRDTAIITPLLDTGARSGEFAGLTLADVDFDLDVLLVLGKGRRERALPFGRTAVLALDRYLRARARASSAGPP